MAVSAAPWKDSLPDRGNSLPACEYRDLGRTAYGRALAVQQDLVARRKTGEIPDQLLFVEHPPVITLGRNARPGHVLIAAAELARRGVAVHAADRGGDVTYHGPGQIVGYPIVDLRAWKRDVTAYVRALEQVMIDAVKPLGLRADRIPGRTGCWVGGAKLGAIGVHISRWVTSHGFALNLSPQLEHFRYIVPCGLDKPVTSAERLTGRAPDRGPMVLSLAESFGKAFGRRMLARRGVPGEPIVKDNEHGK